MTIDINKQYRYANGNPARILCVDGAGKYPVVSIDNQGMVWTHHEDGTSPYHEDFHLLLNEPIPVKLDRAYQTKNGYEVRIYAIDHLGIRPVCGAIKIKEGWVVLTWTFDGKYNTDDLSLDDFDLIPKEVKG